MTTVDRHTLSGTVRELLARFEQMAVQDRRAERLKKLCVVATVAGVLCGIGALVLSDSAGEVALPLGLGAVAAFVGGLVGYFYFSRFDLPNRRVATALRFLRVIAADTPASETLSVEVDFRDYTVAPKTGAADAGGKSSYSLTWLVVTGALADGNRYRVAATEDVARKTKRKRKYTKVRDRIRASVEVQVRLKPTMYGAAAPIVETLRGLPPPAGLRAAEVIARDRVVRATLECAPALQLTGRGGTQTTQGTLLDGHTLLRAILWVYDGIVRGSAAGRAA